MVAFFVTELQLRQFNGYLTLQNGVHQRQATKLLRQKYVKRCYQTQQYVSEHYLPPSVYHSSHDRWDGLITRCKQ